METGTMLTVPVYNPAGEKVGEESIDPADFGGEINKQLLHDVVVQYLANGKAMAGYIAGALVMGVSMFYSFVGHKTITFRTKSHR